MVSTKLCPFFSSTFPFSSIPVRISGPLVSSRSATGRLSSSRTFFTRSAFLFCSSWLPWEKFSLATFMPASISSRITCSLSEAGPNVQIIFVFLIVMIFSLHSFFTFHFRYLHIIALEKGMVKAQKEAVQRFYILAFYSCYLHVGGAAVNSNILHCIRGFHACQGKAAAVLRPPVGQMGGKLSCKILLREFMDVNFPIFRCIRDEK